MPTQKTVVAGGQLLLTPCTFIRGGANPTQCVESSKIIPKHEAGCIGCSSPWRICIACAHQGTIDSKESRVTDPKRGLCEFHVEYGKESVRTSSKVSPMLKDLLESLQVVETTHTSTLTKIMPTSSSHVDEKPITSVSKDILRRVKKAMENKIDVVVPATDIRPFGQQPREYFDPEKMKQLAASIGHVGQLQPGVIRRSTNGETKYELLDGERRWRVALEKGLNFKAHLIEIDNEAVAFVSSVVLNFAREGHTALETSDAIAKMHTKFGVSIGEIAELLGLSLSWTNQMYGLQRLVPEVRVLLDPKGNKGLPVTAAILIAGQLPEKQLPLANKVVEKDLTLSQLRLMLTSRSKPGRREALEPSRQWNVVWDKALVIESRIMDLEAILKSFKPSTMFLPRYVKKIHAILENLRQMQNLLEECERVVKSQSSYFLDLESGDSERER